MKLINYDKYNEKWSPRSLIVNAVLGATAAGFCLGASLVSAITLHDVRHWALPLTFAFIMGARALPAMLVALHNCPKQTKTASSQPV